MPIVQQCLQDAQSAGAGADLVKARVEGTVRCVGLEHVGIVILHTG